MGVRSQNFKIRPFYTECVLLLSGSSNQFQLKTPFTPEEVLKASRPPTHTVSSGLSVDRSQAEGLCLFIFFKLRTQTGKIEKMEVAVVKWRFCLHFREQDVVFLAIAHPLRLCTMHSLHFCT